MIEENTGNCKMKNYFNMVFEINRTHFGNGHVFEQRKHFIYLIFTLMCLIILFIYKSNV